MEGKRKRNPRKIRKKYQAKVVFFTACFKLVPGD